MKYIKTFENYLYDKNFIIRVKKDSDLEKLKYKVEELKRLHKNFKIFDSGSRNKNFYYIVSQDFTRKDITLYDFTLGDNELKSLGDEIDYDLLIASKKYNL